MMKKRMSGLAVGCLLMTNLGYCDLATLNISGRVIASPCEIASDSVNKAVDLGQEIQARDLLNPASSTEWVKFDINLVSCPPTTTSVTMTMGGTPDGTNPDDMYQNTGTAQNVAVQVQGQDGTKLGSGKTSSGTIANNAYTYNLQARAYTAVGSVTPGNISSVVTASFTYQ